MAMCNMNKQLVKIAHVVPEIRSCSDKRTDRQTDTVFTILRSAIGGE